MAVGMAWAEAIGGWDGVGWGGGKLRGESLRDESLRVTLRESTVRWE